MPNYQFELEELQCRPKSSPIHKLFPLKLFDFIPNEKGSNQGRAVVVTNLIDDFCLECINSEEEITYEFTESPSSVNVYLNWGTIHGVSTVGVVNPTDVRFVLHCDGEDITFTQDRAVGWILLSLFAEQIRIENLTEIGDYDFSDELELDTLQSLLFGQEAISDWNDDIEVSYLALEEGNNKWGLEFFAYDNCPFGLVLYHASWDNDIWFQGT